MLPLRTDRQSITVEELAERLAPVLGEEQALLMVRRGLKALGYREGRLSRVQQRGVLAWLGCQEGLAAMAARHLLRRIESESEPPEEVTEKVRIQRDESPRPSMTTSAVTPLGEGVMVARKELVDILARALGDQKAAEIVAQASAKLRLGGERFSLRDTHLLLESLAGEPGIVGVTARFAKARLAMRTA